MEASLLNLDCYNCEFAGYMTDNKIQVTDLRFDNEALNRTMKQIVDTDSLSRQNQRVILKEFSIDQMDYNTLLENHFFSMKIEGVASPERGHALYRCDVSIGKVLLENIADYIPEGAGTGMLTFYNVPVIFYKEGHYDVKLDTSEE